MVFFFFSFSNLFFFLWTNILLGDSNLRPGPTAAITRTIRPRRKENAFYWLNCSTQNTHTLIQPIECVIFASFSFSLQWDRAFTLVHLSTLICLFSKKKILQDRFEHQQNELYNRNNVVCSRGEFWLKWLAGLGCANMMIG